MTDAVGRDLLSGFLTLHSLNQSDAARAVGVSVPTMHDWLKGAKRPRATHRKTLDKWSRGAIPAASWETPDELATQDAVQPFDPAHKAA